MQTVKKLLSELKPDERNTRLHDRRNIDLIKSSLQEFGQYRPFIVDQEMIIRVGNGMFVAMGELGWTEGDCNILTLTPEQAMELSIVDNRAAELSKWDNEKLCETIMALGEQKTSVGFEDKEITEMLDKIAEENINLPDDPEKDVKPVIVCPECGHEWKEK